VNGEFYDNLLSEIVLPFFSALKAGDVNSIKRYIAGDMYESKKVLLEQNKEYPEFLRNYYRGVEFYTENIAEDSGYIIVDISVEYPNGDCGTAKLYLYQINDLNQGTQESEIWKIIDFSGK
jgi:hypothetical protein